MPSPAEVFSILAAAGASPATCTRQPLGQDGERELGVKDEALVLLKVTFPYGWVPFWGMFFGFSSR